MKARKNPPRWEHPNESRDGRILFDFFLKLALTHQKLPVLKQELKERSISCLAYKSSSGFLAEATVSLFSGG